MNHATLGLTTALLLLPAFAARAAETKAPEWKEVVQGNDAFAWDLYAKLRDRQGNLFFSPGSISTALAMTLDGARAQTADQMAKTLHLPRDHERLDRAFAALLKEWNGESKKRAYQLSMANALWGQKGHAFLPEYLKETRDYYGAGLQLVDFAGATEEARKTINRWVEKETHDKIQELLKPGVLGADTRLVLTNAIYFKGNWTDQFKKNLTRDEPFHLSADRKVTVPLMHRKGKYSYLDGDDFQALQLPYEGKDLSMLVLLPKKVDGLAALEKQLTPDRLAGWLSRMHGDEVQVALPRFQLTEEFQLKDVLSGMGMPLAFSRGEADFSGMDGRKDLFISAVVHKAFVAVNEEGTEAAAATGVGMHALAIRVSPVFRADHPFVFVIRDNRSGSILFLGRLTNPRS